MQVDYFRRIKTVLKAQFKVHIINNCPFKDDATSMQDSALAAHEALKKQVADLLQGYVLRDMEDLLLTQQMIETGSTTMQYDGPHVYSILTFQCDFYDRT